VSRAQAALDVRPIVWTFTWTEDRTGAPVCKVLVRYYTDDGRARYQKYGYDRDENDTFYLTGVGVGSLQPSTDDLRMLVEDLNDERHGKHADYYVDDATTVHA